MTIAIIFIFIFLPGSFSIPHTTLYRDQRINIDCSEERSHEAQAAFNSCSQGESREVFPIISEMTDLGDVKFHLCSVLDKVRTDCAGNLRTCFTVEDQQQMIGIEVGQLRTFLVRMTRGKLEQEDIEEGSCRQDLNVQKERQRPVYS